MYARHRLMTYLAVAICGAILFRFDQISNVLWQMPVETTGADALPSFVFIAFFAAILPAAILIYGRLGLYSEETRRLGIRPAALTCFTTFFWFVARLFFEQGAYVRFGACLLLAVAPPLLLTWREERRPLLRSLAHAIGGGAMIAALYRIDLWATPGGAEAKTMDQARASALFTFSGCWIMAVLTMRRVALAVRAAARRDGLIPASRLSTTIIVLLAAYLASLLFQHLAIGIVGIVIPMAMLLANIRRRRNDDAELRSEVDLAVWSHWLPGPLVKLLVLWLVLILLHNTNALRYLNALNVIFLLLTCALIGRWLDLMLQTTVGFAYGTMIAASLAGLVATAGVGMTPARVGTAVARSSADPTLAWLNHLKDRIERCDEGPVIFVAASGGGSRAALWAALALDELRRTKSPWAGGRTVYDHIALTSSVSGGSLACAYVHQGEPPGPSEMDNIYPSELREIARRKLWKGVEYPQGEDLPARLIDDMSTNFMAPLLSGLLLPRRDRGTMVSDKWQQDFGWPETPNTRWPTTDERPLLVLNTAAVSRGNRSVVGFPPLGGTLLDTRADLDMPTIRDLNDEVRGVGYTLAEGVRMSANFPYGMEIATPDQADQRTYLTDGGVIDNFGVDTLAAIAEGIRRLSLGIADPPSQVARARGTRTRPAPTAVREAAATVLRLLRERGVVVFVLDGEKKLGSPSGLAKHSVPLAGPYWALQNAGHVKERQLERSRHARIQAALTGDGWREACATVPPTISGGGSGSGRRATPPPAPERCVVFRTRFTCIEPLRTRHGNLRYDNVMTAWALGPWDTAEVVARFLNKRAELTTRFRGTKRATVSRWLKGRAVLSRYLPKPGETAPDRERRRARPWTRSDDLTLRVMMAATDTQEIREPPSPWSPIRYSLIGHQAPEAALRAAGAVLGGAGSASGDARLRARLARACIWLDRGRTDSALADLAPALRLAPKDWRAQALMGWTQRFLGNAEEAATWFRRSKAYHRDTMPHPRPEWPEVKAPPTGHQRAGKVLGRIASILACVLLAWLVFSLDARVWPPGPDRR